jgi:hypothetical protein
MPRRHLHNYNRRRRVDETTVDLEQESRADFPAEPTVPRRKFAPVHYSPIIAVIGIVIFSLGLIAFLLSLRPR